MIQRPSSLLTTPMNSNKRSWTRLGALFCLSFTANFVLIMSRLSLSSPSSNARFSNNNNNNGPDGLRGTTRSKFELFRIRAKFELFGLESSSEESAVKLQTEQSESSKESEERATERKEFELFSLAEDEMRPKLSALAEETNTTDLSSNGTTEEASAKVELELFASKDCIVPTNDNTTYSDDGVDRVHTDSSEPLHYVPSKSTSFVPKAARVKGDGIVALYTGRSGESKDLKFKTNIQEGQGCVDLNDYVSSHKTAEFTLYSSPALATRAQTAVA